MRILNPNKYIRKAYLDALVNVGFPIWDKRIPKDIDPPARYGLLDSQTKNETVKAKSLTSLTYFEWLCTIDLNLYHVNDKGFTESSIVDDMEEAVINIIRPGISIPNFQNKNVDIINSIDLNTETTTESIDRRVLKLEHWLNRAETI